MSGAWGAPAAWGGAATARSQLPKGSEPCHICGDDESLVDVKLRPCGHELCLACTNRMRQNLVFKPDAGLKCPFCREFVDGFTDMAGRADTVHDLVEANRAARKSRMARVTGQEKVVSTSVPDPQRLAPPLTRTSTAATSSARAADHQHRTTTHKDLLSCSEEELVRYACERHHPAFNRALADAGTAWNNGHVDGDHEAIRQALRGCKHERLMRVIYVLSAPQHASPVALDINGNYTLQNLLEAAHMLRVEALWLQQQGLMPSESFAWLPGSGGGEPLARNAFSRLLKVLAGPLLHKVATHDHGVHVLLKALKLGSPPEAVYIAEQVVPHLADFVSVKEGSFVVCNLAEKLGAIAFGGNASMAPKAVEAMTKLCSQYSLHNRALMQSARHQYQGPALVQFIQGALPHLDAFKAGYQLALNANVLAQSPNGCNTLALLTELKGADARSSEMVRDLACYMAKSLQTHFGQLAARAEHGGARVVHGLVALLAEHREDDWVVSIMRELLAAAEGLRGGGGGGEELLSYCLALPLWSREELELYWANLSGTSLDVPALRRQVAAARGSQAPLCEPKHSHLSDIQPSTPAEAVKRFPHYLRDGAQSHPRHSMLKRTGSQQPAEQQQPQAPPPPPPPKRPPPGFTAGQAAPAGPSKPPPGFAAPIANGGPALAMPQPSGSSAKAAPTQGAGSAAAGPSKLPAASAAPPPQQASTSQQPAKAPAPAPLPPARPVPPAAPQPPQAPRPPAQPAPPPQPAMNVAAQPFVQPSPPAQQLPAPTGLLATAPAFMPQQQLLPPAPRPPHMQQVASSNGSASGAAGPYTPLPLQHSAAPFMPHQQAPGVQPQQLLSQMFGAAAPRPAAAAPPQQQRPPSEGSDFGGFSTLTEMLDELTAVPAVPAPVAPPRPAYRPPAAAYRPPTATAPMQPAPSPAARFPMPGVPPRPPPPPPAAAAPLSQQQQQQQQQRYPAAPPAAPPAARPAAAEPAAASGATWDCKVCTYHHKGKEAHFLSCAMCGMPQT